MAKRLWMVSALSCCLLAETFTPLPALADRRLRCRRQTRGGSTEHVSLSMRRGAMRRGATVEPQQAWDGSMSQLEFMQKDECIVVDDRDTITGTANKYDTHTFGHETPRGVCHRAFSVFLFDEQ
eukprot:CAMPEP_0182581978 /NCGR_PEP_ID=MMETSP1324-20130603/51418_1 /TAXON_ID=236786 /ORGANISM="Florenciella sp., Strain RCC1587" /LENGTH=123 /DNA_ID=CAMNT_0024798399 /DNA_START=48 /DNA_END=416 /DNA_ORIENTATION=+